MTAPIEILDGALGTALIDYHDLDASKTALWSGTFLKHAPDTLVEVHKAYIDAGADIIETATYQCSFEGFEDDGIHAEEAKALFRKSVHLVQQAKAATGSNNVKCAVSLGPYGAICKPGREYDGKYPVPFAFDPSEPLKAQIKLKEWHKRRLAAFYEDEETWKLVDMIALETIPRGDELIALTELMEECEREGIMEGKEWWSTLVMKDGDPPDGGNLEELLNQSLVICSSRGIGVNCTNPGQMPDLVDRFTKSMMKSNWRGKPTLVLYPDGGLIYDTSTQTWSSETGGHGEPIAEDSWAQSLADLAKKAASSGAWRKVIVGGCCKATTGYIKALKDCVDKYA